MDLLTEANKICEFLLTIDEIKTCNMYGSIANKCFDDYSDIDIEIDVSGIDNSIFITKLPEIFRKKYNVIFTDFASSLAPEQYVISIALFPDNPFMIVDISCVAKPHYTTLVKDDISKLNNKFEHILKLFVANLKHYNRGKDCYNDIERMYNKIFEKNIEIINEKVMLCKAFSWLKDNAEEKYIRYINSLEKYIN